MFYFDFIGTHWNSKWKSANIFKTKIFCDSQIIAMKS